MKVEIGKKSLIWLAVFLLIGFASGYSYTNTGFRAPWFATDDETFNTSSATVNVTNATGVLPNASIPLSAPNRSVQNVYSLNESNISVVKQSNGTYAVNLVLGASSGASSGTYTIQNVNMSFVINTVYQNNTNDTAMLNTVTAYAVGSGYYGCNYKTGATNPPTDFVGSQGETTSDMQTFVVLPNYYFAAYQSSGTCYLLHWSVWR